MDKNLLLQRCGITSIFYVYIFPAKKKILRLCVRTLSIANKKRSMENVIVKILLLKYNSFLKALFFKKENEKHEWFFENEISSNQSNNGKQRYHVCSVRFFRNEKMREPELIFFYCGTYDEKENQEK